MAELPDRVRAIATVVTQATRNGEPFFAVQMARRVTSPPEQAAEWLAIAAAGSGDLRRRAIAHAIRLERWYAAVEVAVEEEPSAFDAVLPSSPPCRASASAVLRR